MKIVEADAFYKCESLKNAEFSEGLETIGLFAFFGSGLESVKFPTSLRTIRQGAFAKCEKLRTVVLGEGLEVLGRDDYPPKDATYRFYFGAFDSSAVEHVALPSTLKRIEYRTFNGCKNLRNINLPAGLTYIGERCFKDSALESIAIPARLNKIESSAFSECKCLNRVEFMEGREALGTADTGVWNTIFQDCGIEEVVLPSTLREISPRVFVDCDALRTVLVARGCRARVRKLVGKGVKVQKM